VVGERGRGFDVADVPIRMLEGLSEGARLVAIRDEKEVSAGASLRRAHVAMIAAPGSSSIEAWFQLMLDFWLI
jgi:hypothetical protein